MANRIRRGLKDQIVARYGQGETAAAIARELRCSSNYVSQIWHAQTAGKLPGSPGRARMMDQEALLALRDAAHEHGIKQATTLWVQGWIHGRYDRRVDRSTAWLNLQRALATQDPET